MLTSNTILQTRYQILQRIGGGGMGDVYLAADLRLGNQRVVVKENRGGDPQLFYSEASILASLSHPNMPRVMDHFVDASSGAQYLVMDYIAGQSLQQWMVERGPLPEAQALSLMLQIFNAVKYLHANHIIHRDIKPQNIIITPDGKAVLVDFGIAKVMRPGQATVTAARGFGSPGYAPPEQYTGGTDERSDIYALGATLYFALTNSEPPSATERAAGIVVSPVRAKNPNIAPAIERTISKALELKINQRFNSVSEMEQALRSRSTMPRPLVLAAIPGCLVLLILLAWLVIPKNPANVALSASTVTITIGATTVVVVPTVIQTSLPGSTLTPTFTATWTPLPSSTPTSTPTVTWTWTPTPIPFTPTARPTATSIPRPQGNCADPEASLAIPDGLHVSGYFHIQGTAKDPNFQFYVLEYADRTDNPHWEVLRTSVLTPVDGGELAEWDLPTIRGHQWYIRLTVYLKDNTTLAQCMRWVQQVN